MTNDEDRNIFLVPAANSSVVAWSWAFGDHCYLWVVTSQPLCAVFTEERGFMQVFHLAKFIQVEKSSFSGSSLFNFDIVFVWEGCPDQVKYRNMKHVQL